MQSQFIVPFAAMLAGMVVWVAFVILRVAVRGKRQWSRGAEVGVCLAAGALVVFSSFGCLRAGGPAVGQVVRFGVLLGMAAFTYWKIGAASAAVLMAGAAIVGALALVAFR